ILSWDSPTGEEVSTDLPAIRTGELSGLELENLMTILRDDLERLKNIRRPNGITSGGHIISILPRRSSISQSSIDNILNNMQRFASQERENSDKRISFSTGFLCKKETQMHWMIIESIKKKLTGHSNSLELVNSYNVMHSAARGYYGRSPCCQASPGSEGRKLAFLFMCRSYIFLDSFHPHRRTQVKIGIQFVLVEMGGDHESNIEASDEDYVEPCSKVMLSCFTRRPHMKITSQVHHYEVGISSSSSLGFYDFAVISSSFCNQILELSYFSCKIYIGQNSRFYSFLCNLNPMNQ
ncbi:hypothetical protein MKW98_026993, partial [Papaver atlanticum]